MLEAHDSRSPSMWNVLLHEPLLHFVLLGGLIFGADQLVRASREDPSVTIVKPEVVEEARAIFRNAQGREPTASELETLRERWVDNEVLYREGLALRLDQGDETLRARVIFKALNVIESNLQLPKVDEQTLRTWFEQRRAEYEVPARYDFLEAVMVGDDTSEDAARRFADALNGGAQADVKSGLRVFKARPRNTIVESFGPAFADALDQLPREQWRVLGSKDGLRVVRLEAMQPGEAASFESARERVKQDWEDKQAQELRTSAVRELSKKYQVRLAEPSS